MNHASDLQAPRVTVLTRRTRHTAAWWTIAVLSWVIVLYAALYLLLRERIFPPDLAASFKARPWGIYPHVVVGMIGLTLGPLQFHPSVQARAALHRKIGKAYAVIALGVGVVGLYMSVYSFGGMVTHLGFGLLAAALITTTAVAWRHAVTGRYASHREWMIRSYSLMFAAPTLRLWLPLLIAVHAGDFRPAYLWVAWVSWVPNLAAAEWYIRRSRSRPLTFGGQLVADGAAPVAAADAAPTELSRPSSR